MPSSSNALYVLRLVLADSTTTARRFSTAVARDQVVSAYSAPHSASVSSLATTPDFLEKQGVEYEQAGASLPHSSVGGAHPIPWPKLFDHRQTPPTPPCDLVARLVTENRLDTARRVHDELRALHTHVQPRTIYLSAATQCLAKAIPESRADFLFWLQLYPNRPATKNTPALKATWMPIVHKILEEHADVDFISAFLQLAGKKGLLPAVLPSFISPLAALAPPERSEQILESAMAAYISSTTSATSTSARANRFRELVHQQVTQWWNLYVRSLALVGWGDSARALLYSPPEGISFSRFTRNVVLEQGLDRREAAAAARREAEVDSVDTLAVQPQGEDEGTALHHRIRRALDTSALPTVNALASLQTDLLHTGRRELYDQFHAAFTRVQGAQDAQQSTPSGRATPSVQQQWWWHAEMQRLSEAGDNGGALQLFKEHFLWIGLPTMPSSSASPATASTTSASDATPTPRVIPSIAILTSTLSAVLKLLAPDTILAYHSQYLSSIGTLPPQLRPTRFTHLAFMREITHRLGPSAGISAMYSTVERGIDPGEPAWNALMLSLVGHGRGESALSILEGMEGGVAVGAVLAADGSGIVSYGAGTGSGSASVSASRRSKSKSAAKSAKSATLPAPSATHESPHFNRIHMPPPSSRSYAGPLRLLLTHGKEKEARIVLEKLQVFMGRGGAEGGVGGEGGGEGSFGAGVQGASSVDEQPATAQEQDSGVVEEGSVRNQSSVQSRGKGVTAQTVPETQADAEVQKAFA